MGEFARFDPATAAKLQASLKAASRAAKREVTKSLNQAVEPLKDDIRAEALAKLPARGGLAERIAASRMTVTKRLSGDRPSVTLRVVRTKTGGKTDLGSINRGRLRRPTFGHRPWVDQPVPPGFFTDATLKNIDRVRTDLLEALRRAAASMGH